MHQNIDKIFLVCVLVIFPRGCGCVWGERIRIVFLLAESTGGGEETKIKEKMPIGKSRKKVS